MNIDIVRINLQSSCLSKQYFFHRPFFRDFMVTQQALSVRIVAVNVKPALLVLIVIVSLVSMISSWVSVQYTLKVCLIVIV